MFVISGTRNILPAWQMFKIFFRVVHFICAVIFVLLLLFFLLQTVNIFFRSLYAKFKKP